MPERRQHDENGRNFFKYELANQFVHGEHVNLADTENGLQALITDNFTFIVGVLEVISFDMTPNALHDLRSRTLGAIEEI